MFLIYEPNHHLIWFIMKKYLLAQNPPTHNKNTYLLLFLKNQMIKNKLHYAIGTLMFSFVKIPSFFSITIDCIVLKCKRINVTMIANFAITFILYSEIKYHLYSSYSYLLTVLHLHFFHAHTNKRVFCIKISSFKRNIKSNISQV